MSSDGSSTGPALADHFTAFTISVCELNHDNETTPFDDLILPEKPSNVKHLFNMAASKMKWAERGFNLDVIHLYWIPPDPSIIGDPAVSRKLLNRFVKIGYNFVFSSLAGHKNIKNDAALLAQYQSGLPSGARIVVVLPAGAAQVATGGPGVAQGAEISAAIEAAVIKTREENLRLLEAVLAKEREEQAKLRADEELFRRMDPFARSHHSETISVNSPPGSVRFPPKNQRLEFKKNVIRYYGLMVDPKVDDYSMVYNMFGELVTLDEAELAHIWPRSYTNWDDVTLSLCMPGEFYKNPRNFIIIPSELHSLFDDGHIIFTPAKEGAYMEIYVNAVLPETSHIVQKYNKFLFRNAERPYCRLLAYFGLMAKKTINVTPLLKERLHAAATYASDDSVGRNAVIDVSRRLHAVKMTNVQI